jgi:DNA (cytosine-5)-methyltransferase 1
MVEKLCGRLIPMDHRVAWRTIRDAVRGLPEPVKRGEKAEIANHVQHPGARTYPGHGGSVLDMPAKTVKAGAHGTAGGENIALESDGKTARYFTTREAARLQTFPDEWVFTGSWGACIRQLGNAVPVDLATIFARRIHQELSTEPQSVEYAQRAGPAAALTS